MAKRPPACFRQRSGPVKHTPGRSEAAAHLRRLSNLLHLLLLLLDTNTKSAASKLQPHAGKPAATSPEHGNQEAAVWRRAERLVNRTAAPPPSARARACVFGGSSLQLRGFCRQSRGGEIQRSDAARGRGPNHLTTPLTNNRNKQNFSLIRHRRGISCSAGRAAAVAC